MISIIIPVYNMENYIQRSFTSLINQTIGFENLEIIFVDDCSTDNSKNIIQEFSNQYGNVKSIFLNKNSGSGGHPRNIGMSYATKDFIMFLDADDIFMEDACKVLYDEIVKEDIDIVSGTLTYDGKNPAWNLWANIFSEPQDNPEIRESHAKNIVENKFPLKIDSLDEYASIIGDYGFTTKIYKKSFLEENSIDFPEGIIGEDSVFLFNTFLNAKCIKYIDNVVYMYYNDRVSGNNISMSHNNSKHILEGMIDAFFNMYYLSLNYNKSDIFKQYLLFYKLRYFLNRLLASDLSVGDTLDLLIYSMPLFKLYINFNRDINSNLSLLFQFISHKYYEDALSFIYGEDSLNLKEIKISSNCHLFKEVCDFIGFDKSSLDQLKYGDFDLFIFNYDEDYPEDSLNIILNYCRENNIASVCFSIENNDIFNKNLNFDLILTKKDINLDNNKFYLTKNSLILTQILDKLNFKYIPDLKHIVLFYELNNLNELNDIHNHFYSINYPFKHLKLITNEDNLFLSNTILKSDLNNIHSEENYYFSFADLNLNPNDFVNELINYIHNDVDSEDIKNMVFPSSLFDEVLLEYLKN